MESKGLKILQVSNRVPFPLNEGGTIGIIINAFPTNLNKPKDFESRAFKVLLSNGKIISKLREQIEVISEN